MDNDATTLQNALAVLRQSFGEQLGGPQQRTEAQMRYVLRQEMGLDELMAGRVVKKLHQTGRLVYVANTDGDTDPDSDPNSTGPVISMPGMHTSGTGAPLIVTASPGLIMGIANDEGGGAGGNVTNNSEGEIAGQVVDTLIEEEPAPVTTGEREEAEGARSNGYWRIG